MPTLARTQQMMKESFGQADDKVRLIPVQRTSLRSRPNSPMTTSSWRSA
jgi:hypothetical protein